MLPSKVQNQISLMKIAIKQSELIEDFNYSPIEGDKIQFEALKRQAISSYDDTMKLLAEQLLEIETAY